MNVRVRIAPSPTGFAHIGTAYAALFNWAFAQKYHGAFVMRLDDTDQKRHVPEAEQALYNALEWLKLPPDESPLAGGPHGPYRQSQQLDLYREEANKLLETCAYRKDGAIWLKITQSEAYAWDDIIRGHIEFQGKDLKDWVILKSDGYPTYNFANVIDDIHMRITHVIRGEEHISNTPLQLSIYRSLGVQSPLFAHFPVLRGSDRRKLSKRRDPVSLEWFRQQGYLPDAILNFLALQGWSHPKGKDIFTREEFVESFSLERVKTSAPMFDIQKLDWINGHYIRSMSVAELTTLVSLEFASDISRSLIDRVLPLVRDRMRKLSEFEDLTGYFINPPKLETTLFLPITSQPPHKIAWAIEMAVNTFDQVESWDRENLEKAGKQLIQKTAWPPKELFMTIRLAITGRTATPPLFEVMVTIGQDESISRLWKAKGIINESVVSEGR